MSVSNPGQHLPYDNRNMSASIGQVNPREDTSVFPFRLIMCERISVFKFWWSLLLLLLLLKYSHFVTQTQINYSNGPTCVLFLLRNSLWWLYQFFANSPIHLRDGKRFWCKLWVDNGRPREGSVFSVYKDVEKTFRRIYRYHVANQSRNEHYKLYEMIKARDMTGFWNVIKRRRSIQVKSSLTASDFNSLYGDVMQALSDLVTIKHVLRKLLIQITWIIVKLWKCKPLT